MWSGYVSALNVEAPLAPLPEAETERERLYLTSRGIVSGYHAIRASESRLAKHAFIAPFDGVVTATNVEPGSMVRAGQPLGSFVGTGRFEVKSAVHARHSTCFAQVKGWCFEKKVVAWLHVVKWPGRQVMWTP